MRLSTLQEWILIVLESSDRPLYCKEIVRCLNEGQSLQDIKKLEGLEELEGLLGFSEQTVSSTANRMIRSGLLHKEQGGKYNRTWYSITEDGRRFLFEAKDKRARLAVQFLDAPPHK